MQKLENYIQEMKQLLWLALPLMISQLFNQGKGMVDTMMVGHIDKYNLAGLSLANGVYMVIVLFGVGTGVALISILSRLYAQQDFDKIKYYSQQGLYINFIVCVIIMIILLNCDFVFNQLENLEPQTRKIASDYLKIMAWVLPISGLMFIFRPVLQSFVKNKQLLLISGVMFAFNIPLNYLFIYTLDMGAVGSAWATVICFLLENLFLYFMIIKNPKRNIFTKFYKPNWEDMVSLFKLGMPIGLTIVVSLSLFTGVTFMLAEYGEIYIGAHNLAVNFLSFIFMFGLGLNFVLIQRISFYIGLGQTEKLKVVIVSAFMLSTVVSLFTMCLTYIFRYQIPQIYTSNQEIINIAAYIFVISMVYQLFDSLQAVCTGILRGFKLNKITLNVSLFAYWVVGLGSGILLSQNYGIYGYWYGFCICFIVAVAIYVRKIYKIVWLGEKYDEH